MPSPLKRKRSAPDRRTPFLPALESAWRAVPRAPLPPLPPPPPPPPPLPLPRSQRQHSPYRELAGRFRTMIVADNNDMSFSSDLDDDPEDQMEVETADDVSPPLLKRRREMKRAGKAAAVVFAPPATAEYGNAFMPPPSAPPASALSPPSPLSLSPSLSPSPPSPAPSPSPPPALVDAYPGHQAAPGGKKKGRSKGEDRDWEKEAGEEERPRKRFISPPPQLQQSVGPDESGGSVVRTIKGGDGGDGDGDDDDDDDDDEDGDDGGRGGSEIFHSPTSTQLRARIQKRTQQVRIMNPPNPTRHLTLYMCRFANIHPASARRQRRQREQCGEDRGKAGAGRMLPLLLPLLLLQ